MARINIIHTSDWHLGKKLYSKERTGLYKSFIDWLVAESSKKQADYLFVAGDIFDTFNPPHDAINLFYSFLSKIKKLALKHVYIIAGNHDSGFFLEIPNNIINQSNITIIGKIKDNPYEHYIENEDFNIVLLPYFKKNDLYPWFKRYEIEGEFHDSEGIIIKKFFDSINENKNPNKNTFLLAHHNFGDYEITGSEHLISLTGVETLKECLSKATFDYIALGHIHKYQNVSSKMNAYYCGSPYPLRFSEKEKKSVNKISIEDGNIEVRRQYIPEFERLISISAKATEIIDNLNKLEISKTPTLINLEIIYNEFTSGLLDSIERILKEKNIELISLKQSIESGERQDYQPSKQIVDDISLLNEYLENEFQENINDKNKIIDEYIKIKNQIEKTHDF